MYIIVVTELLFVIIFKASICSNFFCLKNFVFVCVCVCPMRNVAHGFIFLLTECFSINWKVKQRNRRGKNIWSNLFWNYNEKWDFFKGQRDFFFSNYFSNFSKRIWKRLSRDSFGNYPLDFFNIKKII